MGWIRKLRRERDVAHLESDLVLMIPSLSMSHICNVLHPAMYVSSTSTSDAYLFPPLEVWGIVVDAGDAWMK